jgi:hypothetical protein
VERLALGWESLPAQLLPFLNLAGVVEIDYHVSSITLIIGTANCTKLQGRENKR